MSVSEQANNDPTGHATLDVIARAHRFNQWMYSTIKPFCKGKIFEVGSGIGNISRFFIEDHQQILLSDFREVYCKHLAREFGNSPGVLGIEVMDLIDPDFDSRYTRHLGKNDTVFALNVLEHIADEKQALNNCYKLLSEGGQLVILVPSYGFLFNSLDRDLDHYRRYTKSSLSRVFASTGFQVIYKQYFNFTGIFGWYFSGNILRKKIIPGNQMRLYNYLMPAIKILDKIVFNRAGLSTILVGRKI
jgi:2-polyprenyl-3-methyl-5-hydroxy-6-metoxy-1,4-benzoquinol methylase